MSGALIIGLAAVVLFLGIFFAYPGPLLWSIICLVLKAPPLKKFLKPGLDVRFTSNSFTILNVDLAPGVRAID
jgi:hypothetical protein